MINSTKNIRVTRSISHSAIGRRFDRDIGQFARIPHQRASSCKSIQHRSLQKSTSKNMLRPLFLSKQPDKQLKMKNHKELSSEKSVSMNMKKPPYLTKPEKQLKMGKKSNELSLQYTLRPPSITKQPEKQLRVANKNNDLSQEKSVSTNAKRPPYLSKQLEKQLKAAKKNNQFSQEKSSSMQRPPFLSQQSEKQQKVAKKDNEMKIKIKQEIDMLRASTNKSKKLVLGDRKSQQEKFSTKPERCEPQNQDEKPVTINSWKDVKKMAPSTGYFYIDCHHQSISQHQQKKITLSKNWVLITAPEQQTIISINEYAEALRKFESLQKIDLFKKFLLIKTFRKWKLMTQYNQLNIKRNQIERQLQGVYRQVYTQLVSLLDRIRIFKFVGGSKTHSLALEEYHEYLFNCSSELIQEIHDFIFVACMEVIFNPIRELAVSLRRKAESTTKGTKSEDLYSNIHFQQIEKKYERRMLRIMLGKASKSFQLVKSIEFRQSFLQYFCVLKKCLYIFNQAYIEWVRACLFQLITKIEGSLMSWQQQKPRFGQILNDIISHHCQKYAFYSPDFNEKEIGYVSYICQINQNNLITFQANQDYLFALFTQYADFLIKNLSFQKMVECYARSRPSSTLTELQLLDEIVRTNDAYNCSEILKSFPIEEEFKVRLKSAIAINFFQVLEVIDFYNLLITNFFNCQDQFKTPSEIYEYLQSVKIKLLYLPKCVDVGLFALDFTNVHEYLSIKVVAMQTELYINVPAHFRQLFSTVHEVLDSSYKGIRNSMWTVDELLSSYSYFEAYQEYRINQLHEDLDKFKNYIEVISAKCPQHYHECFIMLIHIKELRDKLQIKTQIFTQRLPARLKAFRSDIENLKEDIWRDLYTEQTQVIVICKEQQTIAELLKKLEKCDARLKLIKQKMDKLEVIGRLQLEYFIEQELTVNTHSYHKMSNDVKFLINFTQKFVDFQDMVHKIFPKYIVQIRSDGLLDVLRVNVSEIKEVYLLLIVYETVLRSLLQNYEGWRQYLETVDEIAFLSAEELIGVRRLKELNLHSKIQLTFEECFNINIHSVYEEIHQIKEKKIKVSELQLIFSDLDKLEIQPPFQIRRSRRRESLKGKGIRSGRSLDEGRNDIIKYEFENFGNIYRSLQQFQNELKGLTNSPYLADYKFEISMRVERLDKAVKLLQEISDARSQYNVIMEVQLFEEESHERQERKWLLSQEILAFFQNYRHQRQQVRQFWIKLVNGLSKKSLSELLTNNEDVDNLIRLLGTKMRSLRECVEILVKKKRQEIYMLNLVDNSTVLAVVQYPAYYFELFYSVRQVRKPNSELQLITVFDQILTLHKAENQKDSPIQINSFELKISNELRKLLAAHQNQHPIDNLLNYMSLQLPLQIVYVLDQLYFAERYLSNQKSSPQILRNLEGEIKLICRNGLRQELDSAHINYTLALFDQLLASRIQLRTRVEHNPTSEIWYRNVLIFQLYQNMLTLRNFNTQILSSFRLVDPTALALAFPFCEKALVKICNAMKFQESIVVQQTEIVATIAARTMSLFYKVNLTQANIENVLFACQQLYPLFVIGFLNNLEKDLVFVFEELNKIERINSLRTNISKDRRLLPSIFIHCEQSSTVELSQTLKLRFRTVNAVSPCPEVMLSIKMLNHDFLIEKGTFLNIIFLLKAYVILLRQQKHYYISFQDLGHICDKIMRKLSLQPVENNEGVLFVLLRDYFQAIDYPLEKLMSNFIAGKNRIEFQKSAIYELAQNIVLNSIKQFPMTEDSALMIRIKEYETMKKSFQKYSEQLILQKFDAAFVDKLGNLFELSFNLQNRPIAVIGPCQSGKNLLFKLFSQFLREVRGRAQLSWRNCNLEIFNAVLGTTITENEPIIQQFVTESEQKDISWIIFEGFAFQQNFSLFEHIFSRMGQDVRLKSLPLGDSALSFCQLYHLRQRYLEKMHSLHNKYVGFKLQSLRGVAPSYICSMSKVYLSDNTLSLAGVYQLKINQFLRDLIDKNEELYIKITQDFSEISKFLFTMIDEVLVKKVKNLDWAMVITHKSALERIMKFFFSFFYREGRQKLDFLYSSQDHLMQLFKLMTYSFHATFQNFVERNSAAHLHKIIKSTYYVLSQEQTRDKFLGKYCYFTSKELVYLTVDQLSLIQDNARDLPQNSIIQTYEMKLIYKKYLRQLVQVQSAILIVGGKQSGKTALIKLFIDKYFTGQMMIKGNNEELALRELSKKLIGMGETSPHTTSSQAMMRKLDYCIYIEDVSCNQKLTKLEKYLLYIIQNGIIIEGLHLRAAPLITTIIERRTVSEEVQDNLWNCFVISFQTTKEYFDSIFSTFVSNKLQTNFKSKGKKNMTISIFEKLTQKYLKIVRYCSENFKRGHKSWTYQFGIVTLKSIISNFIDRYNYEDLLSEEELSSRMNIEIMGRLLSRLQELREVQKIEDRIAGLFDGTELKAMHQRSLRENVLLNCNLDQENLNNARIKNVILTESVRSFAPKLAIALRSANCILINKANVPFNRSVASACIQLLKLPYRQLFYCDNESKFLSQIERANQLTLKKNSISYYYISLEETMGNPQIIHFIQEYLNKQAQQFQTKDAYYHQCKFILEYSKQNHNLISHYLQSGILPYSYIMHFNEKSGDDMLQIANRLLQDCNTSNGTCPLNREMETAIKIALRILDELKVFEPPKHLVSYMFQKLNVSYLILSLINTYGQLLKKIQTKKKGLELSLSELNYMFKEYKQRKAVYKQLQAEEASLLSIIGMAKDDHRRRNLEYNSIKNQNLKEAIQHNELQISKLQRERDQLISSEKIWSNIYRNTHAAISRTEFAQIKYMFLTNYSIERQLFEAIAFVLGQETDLPSLKKCFSDINIMARIKDLKVPELPETRLRQLEGRIESISKRDKLSCGRNIVEWMKVGCRLGIYRLQRDGTLKSLQARIKRYEEQNKQIRQKNRMDEMEKQLVELEKKIAQKSADLNVVHLKINSIGNQLQQVKKQFEELIEFQTFCLQELQNLQENSKKLLNFCIFESLQFTFVQMLAGQSRRKFRELINTKLRKTFGGIITKEESDYFDLLREPSDRQNENWLLKSKEYLSSGKKRLIGEINNFLLQQSLPLMVVDRRSVLIQDTIKNNTLFLRVDNLHQNSRSKERDFEKYSLIILEVNSWEFSLQLSESQYQTHGKFKIFKQRDLRVSIPGNIPLILIVNDHGPEELMTNFKIIDLEYSVDDYYEIVYNTVAKKRAERKYDIFGKMVRVERKFMDIVYFLCKKTQNITLKSKELIKTLTGMIQNFNKEKAETRHNTLQSMPIEQPEGDIKLCRVLSKIIELMITLFPSEEHTSFFFRDLLNTSFDYIEMEGVRDIHSIINLIMELLTEGFKDKFPFLYLYYIRIYAVEEAIATPIESLNLTALPDPRQLIVDALKDADRDPSNFFKYLPFKNIELQKIYGKLSKARVRNQSQVARIIQSEKNLSLFNKLILKRALAPKSFEIEIGRIIRDFEDKITLKNKMFLRRYVVKQRLFCVCDAGFWVSKLKFTDEFRLVQLSELQRTQCSIGRMETWAVFDDMQDNEQKTQMLQYLVKLNCDKVSIVLFSKQFLRQDFREQFKFLPFQHLLNIFQIKELTKVSRSKYSHIFNKVIYFKTELLRRKPFNQRISFSFLFEKIREQIMNKEDYSIDEIILHFEWDFFLWDSSFETNHLTLQFILSALDANPELINQFVADDKLQDRINAVISRSRFLQFHEIDICRLATQLRDSSARLDVRGTDRKDTDIFYLEFEYKKMKLMKEMEVIKRIAEIHIGRIEVTAELVVELEYLLKNFDYGTFSDVLVKLIAWRRLQQSRAILNIGLIASEFNFYLLFQSSVYIYYEMPSIDIENLPEDNIAGHSNEQIPSLTQTKSNFDNPNNLKQLMRQSAQKIGTHKRMSKIPVPESETHHRQSKRTTKSLSLMKQLISKSRRISIVDTSLANDPGQKSQEQFAQEYFKNSLYIIENRVFGLKKLGIKDQKNLVGMSSARTLDLPNNFSLRIIELNNVVSSGKQSRFKIIPQRT